MTSLERVRAVLSRKMPDIVPHALYDVAIPWENIEAFFKAAQTYGRY
jgi:hypothetical protein